MYYLDGDTLKLTHYCHAEISQRWPRRTMPQQARSRFDFVGATNLKPDDLHMHHAV